MVMDRNVQRIGLVNLAALLLVGFASQWLARYSGSAVCQVGVIYLGLGVLVAALSYFQMRLAAREQLEQLEADELRKAHTGSALFASPEADLYPARRAREQFDRFFVPAFTVVLFLLQGAAVYWLWPWLGQVPPPPFEPATIAMALTALFFLAFFLLGKYSAGVARLENQRLLRPAASFLLLGAVIFILTAIVEAVIWFGYAKSDAIVARVLTVFLGLAAAETLINLVLEVYRPRVKGQTGRLLYESRLIGLLSQPGGLITTAAQALDYQFGFKVSETWFYQFLEKALAWIILLQLAVLWLSTMLVIIEPQEQGMLEHFGQVLPGRALLEPGLHLKWPWPVDRVHRFPTREIQTFYVGFVPDPERDKEKTLLWTRPHFKEEFNLMVASREVSAGTAANVQPGEQPVPVNLLSVNIPIQYRIRDVQAWTYHFAEAPTLLEAVANREVVRYLVNVDIEQLMTVGRLPAAEQLKARIQKRADELQLGVEILFVGLQGIHPPVNAAGAYEAVVGAMKEKETNILAAWAYEAGKIPSAQAMATNFLAKTEIESHTKVAVAQAEAGQFTNQLTAFRASPSVYLERSYLEALVGALGPARKYVLATTNTQDIIWINLEDTIRDELLQGAVLPEAKK
jgi:modulator of FtsH protease HflK